MKAAHIIKGHLCRCCPSLSECPPDLPALRAAEPLSRGGLSKAFQTRAGWDRAEGGTRFEVWPFWITEGKCEMSTSLSTKYTCNMVLISSNANFIYCTAPQVTANKRCISRTTSRNNLSCQIFCFCHGFFFPHPHPLEHAKQCR